MRQRSLENYKVFPYVAFATIIGFAVFVGAFAISMVGTLSTLEAATNTTTEALTESTR